MKGPWLKLYTEIIDDPKVQLLDAELFRLYINLLCIAKRTDKAGKLPTLKELAFMLRVNEKKIREQIEDLEANGLIDFTEEGYEIHGWSGRQEEHERVTNAERQRRYKERHSQQQDNKGNVTGNVTGNGVDNADGNGNGNAVGNDTSNAQVTPLELELDKELDKEREKEIEKESAPAEPSPEPPQKVHRFKKPTLEELTAYCLSKGYIFSPERFLNHYESNGWKVGRTTMQNWKKAAANWNDYELEKRQGGSKPLRVYSQTASLDLAEM